MIFVTVGHQMPFDRLIGAVDAWAATKPGIDVFAQIGRTESRPQSMKWKERVEPTEFRELLSSASVVVAHAGMGTILSALEIGRPVLVMPRRADLRETRNDHQFATATRLSGRPGVYIALDESSLRQQLDQLGIFQGGEPIDSAADASLLDAVRRFVFGARTDAALCSNSGRRHSAVGP